MLNLKIYNGMGNELTDAEALTALEALLHHPGIDPPMRVEHNYQSSLEVFSGKFHMWFEPDKVE